MDNFKHFLIGTGKYPNKEYRSILRLEPEKTKTTYREIIIGRSEKCDHVIKDKSIRKTHCSLEIFRDHGYLESKEKRSKIYVNKEPLRFGKDSDREIKKIDHGDKIRLGNLYFIFHVVREKVKTIDLTIPEVSVKPIIKRDIRLADLRSKGYHLEKAPYCSLPEDFDHDYFDFSSMREPFRFHREHYQYHRVEARTFADYDSDD